MSVTEFNPNWHFQLQFLDQSPLEIQPTEPLAHYGVLWLQAEADGFAELDFTALCLKAGQALFWQPGQVLKLQARIQGFYLSMGLDALCQQGLSDQFLQALGLFGSGGSILELSTERFRQIDRYWQDWYQEYATASQWLNSAWLRLILLYCAQEKQNKTLSKPLDTEQETLWHAFERLLESHFRQWHQVSDYADALAVTAGHLNQRIKQRSGRNVKAHIQERLMLEARRAAYFSDQSLKEVAYELGFDDPAYFSRLFKRCTGQRFRDFREQRQIY